MTTAPRQSADAKAQSALAVLNALSPVAPRAEQLAALKTALADRHFHLRAKDEALQEYAALALGESRRPEALELLRDAWTDIVTPEGRAALIRAAALHRSEPAFEWLLEIIATGTPTLAAAAVEALSVYERNTKLLAQVNAAKARRDAAL